MCIYSLYLFNLFWLFIFDLIKYSTALTSCLVTFSNSLTFSASEKLYVHKIHRYPALHRRGRAAEHGCRWKRGARAMKRGGE